MVLRKVKACCHCFPRGVRKCACTCKVLALLAGLTAAFALLREGASVSLDISSRFNYDISYHAQQQQQQQRRITDASRPTINSTYLMDGFARAEWTRRLCENITSAHPEMKKITLRITKDTKSMVCPTYKIGSTFWRRVFTTNLGRSFQHLVNPYLVPFDRELPSESMEPAKASNRFDFKFTFVRDPYARLYSLYVDKLLAPNPYFWKAIGSKVIRFNRPFVKPGNNCGSDATFPEFIKYIIHCLETKKDVDPHFVPMETNCLPCQVNYTFIGSMESFATDTDLALRRMEFTKTADLLRESGSTLVAEDAIRDTLKQPFAFKKRYVMCMSVHDAIQLAWNKLRLRGLIGNDTLTLETAKINTYREDDIVKLALESRARSTKQARKAMVAQFYNEYWRKISKADLNRLPILYSMDFLVFKYDPYPQSIFNPAVS